MMALGLPSLVAKDFNCIMGSHEKMDGRYFVDNIDFRQFRRFIDNLPLIDLGYTGLRFSWCNNRTRMTRFWKRIDQALAIANWFQHFQGHKVQHFPRSILTTACSSPPLIARIYLGCHSYLKSSGCSPILMGSSQRGLEDASHRGTRYRVTWRHELARHRLLQWNWHEIGDIFRH